MNFLQQLNLATVNAGACDGNGHWSLHQGESIDSINPATEAVLGHVNLCSAADYEKIVEEAHKAAACWRNVPAPKRGELIRRLGNALREKKDALGSLVAMEMGKSKQEGDGEVQEMIDIADFAVGQSRMLYGLSMHSERSAHRMYEQWHPLGAIGVISAFNFPVAVWAWNAFIAVICGNTVVWKPSSKTPLCAIAVQHMCNAVMHEMGCEGVFSFFIPEDHRVTEQFVKDKRLPLISFTGSTRTGRVVAEKVASRLGRYLLELGGNNAVILDKNANVSLAIPGIVFGAVGTAGQRCTTTRRLLVPRDNLNAVAKQLTAVYQQITIGDPLDEKNLMGPLVDAQAVEQYCAAIAELKSLGADICYGGNPIAGTGFYVEPTLVIADNAWDIVQRETFAPILYVIPYDNLEDAIALQNDVAQGLSSAIFTDSLQSAEQFLSAKGSDCGIANVNIGTSGAEIGGAFGGEKETGGGRESGSDAWKAYMRRQTNTINWGSDLPLAQGIKFEIKS